MARKPASDAPSPATSADPRSRAVDSLLRLAAGHRWEDITLPMIAEGAQLSLADLRDLFPSKGAILGGFIRRIDRIVLETTPPGVEDEPARERVHDLMLRRFEALAPYREALRSIRRGLGDEPLGLLAMNQQALNSWRYLLASVGIETDGALGALRLQGAVLVMAGAFPTFLEDSDGLPATMAHLDRALDRGERALRRAEGLHRLAAPFRGFCRAAKAARRDARRPSAPETPAAL